MKRVITMANGVNNSFVNNKEQIAFTVNRCSQESTKIKLKVISRCNQFKQGKVVLWWLKSLLSIGFVG